MCFDGNLLCLLRGDDRVFGVFAQGRPKAHRSFVLARGWIARKFSKWIRAMGIKSFEVSDGSSTFMC